MSTTDASPEDVTKETLGAINQTSESCNHNIHPAYAGAYKHPRCPACRMISTTTELQYIDHDINVYGGTSQWREHINDLIMAGGEYKTQASLWQQAVRGGDSSNTVHVDMDDNCKDWSHRHAKKRLHNLINELNCLAQQELNWREKYAASIGDSSKDVGTHSAASTLWYYKRFSREHGMHTIEEGCARFARKRGREWEISTDPDYPEDRLDNEDLQNWFYATPEQRAFIDAANVTFIEETSARESPGTLKKKRRTDAKVCFDPHIHIRSDADIDSLRRQSTFLSGNAPKRAEELSSLKDGPGNHQASYRRTSSHYNAGQWTVPKDYICVDTSGNCFESNYEKWKVYIEGLEMEAMEMDKWDAMGYGTRLLVLLEEQKNVVKGYLPAILLVIVRVLSGVVLLLWVIFTSWMVGRNCVV